MPNDLGLSLCGPGSGVFAATGFVTEHRSMATAWEQVKAVHGRGLAGEVYRWSGEGWVLYRRLEPPGREPGEEPRVF